AVVRVAARRPLEGGAGGGARRRGAHEGGGRTAVCRARHGAGQAGEAGGVDRPLAPGRDRGADRGDDRGRDGEGRVRPSGTTIAVGFIRNGEELNGEGKGRGSI